MARLVLGPLVRHIGSTDATVWVETSAPCEVDVLGRRERTFHVEGHHYAIVVIDGLEPGSSHEYEVLLDGERAWPLQGSELPASRIRTVDPDRPLWLLFGSCRGAHPQRPPYTLTSGESPDGHGVDALRSLALRTVEDEPDRWPAAMIMVGDQVYADEVPPGTAAFIESRRDPTVPPGDQVANFAEYCELYREAWSEDVIRWFMSTVSTAMLFDDHDVHDDWNIARAWIERTRRKPWWQERIVGAFMSYWIYQHLGNLSPRQLAEDELLAQVKAADDAGPLLREVARRRRRPPPGGVPPQLRPDAARDAMELLPRLRPGAPAGHRLPCRARAGAGPAADGRRSRVGVDRRLDAGRLRPPAPRHVRPLPPLACDPRAPGVERGDVQRCMGPLVHAHLGADPRGGRPRPLGVVPGVVRADGKAAGRHRHG